MRDLYFVLAIRLIINMMQCRVGALYSIYKALYVDCWEANLELKELRNIAMSCCQTGHAGKTQVSRSDCDDVAK